MKAACSVACMSLSKNGRSRSRTSLAAAEHTRKAVVSVQRPSSSACPPSTASRRSVREPCNVGLGLCVWGELSVLGRELCALGKVIRSSSRVGERRGLNVVELRYIYSAIVNLHRVLANELLCVYRSALLYVFVVKRQSVRSTLLSRILVLACEELYAVRTTSAGIGVHLSRRGNRFVL